MIYFIQFGESGPVKIGYTKSDPIQRLQHLEVGSPEKLYLLAVVEGDIFIEKNLHKKFNVIRKRGEWFYPTLSLMRFINSLDKTLLIEELGKDKLLFKVYMEKISKKTQEKRFKMVQLWDEGKTALEIVGLMYSGDGGNQRKEVKVALLEAKRIKK